MLRRTFTIALSAAVMAVTAGSVSGEPLKVRINWSVTPSHLTPLIPLIPKEVYKHYGKSYVVEASRMQGTGPALTALASGELDVGAISYQGFALGIVNAKLNAMAIADVLQDHPPHASDAFWVRKDSDIHKVEDLKGKRVAVNARGSGVDAGVRVMLLKHGMKENDYQIVEIRFPAMLPALESKRVDLAFLVNPFDFLAEKAGKFRELFSLRDAMGTQVTVVWVANESYIKAHRAALVDLLEDQILMRRWLAKHPDQMAALLSKLTKQPAKNFASWVMTEKDAAYHSPDMTFDVPTLQQNVNTLVQLKSLPHSFPVAEHVDLSLAKEAAAREGMK